MTTDYALYVFSILTFVAIKVSFTGARSNNLDYLESSPILNDRLDKIRSLYAFMNEADETPEKRRSLLRFGKRRSLFRFGKRGSILRFGKRSGYAPYTSDDYLPYYPSQSFDGPRDFDEFGLPEKRSTLFRFGKKSSGVDMKDFERDNSKKPHTPWRFGREEEEEDLSSEKTD